ncbi:hypothetical protein SAMN03159341_103245 [Paenibacillus sp. 1_12]|nr:hypothetical protein SAMN03159341_103245 [Paenibacillus sp. 1_12]
MILQIQNVPNNRLDLHIIVQGQWVIAIDPIYDSSLKVIKIR